MLKLVEFQSTDNLALPGLLYEPEKPTKKAILYLYGNGSTSVFYNVQRANLLGELFNNAGISYLAFNNRGAHLIKSLKKNKGTESEEKLEYGTTYELIKECLYDIDGAISYLKGLGYEEFYLLGHSTGANKICVYDYYKEENPVKGYILIGPGDDTGIFYKEMGEERFKLALSKSKKMIDEGKGTQIVPKDLVNYWFSYQALYDTINPDGDYNTFPFTEAIEDVKLSKKELFKEFKQIDKPTLTVMGELDEFAFQGTGKVIKAMESAAEGKDNFKFVLLEGADHSFTNKEKELAEIIINWLK